MPRRIPNPSKLAADVARAHGRGLSGYIKYCEVSNIDQQLRKPEAHVGSITVRHWPLPVTESVALPPDLRRA